MLSLLRTFDAAPPPPIGFAQDGLICGDCEFAATEFNYRCDAYIFGEGQPAEYVYQVVSGAVRSYRLLDDGRRQIGAFQLAGDIFGLEVGPCHRLTAEATVRTRVRMVRRRAIEAAARRDAGLAYKLWAITSAELRHAEDHMVLLGRKTAAQRVASFLLEMDRRLSRFGEVALPVSRRDIADYLGLTLETVSRLVSEFHEKGLLTFFGPRRFRLRDRARLAAMDA